MMRILLINPPLVLQRGDFLGSGIPYMPHGLAYLAAALRVKGHQVRVVDIFGEDPFSGYRFGRTVLQGAHLSIAAGEVSADLDAIFIYARSVMTYSAIVQIIGMLRGAGVRVPIIVFENAQAVIGFSLALVSRELIAAGADYVMTGDPEEASIELLQAIAGERDWASVRGVFYGAGHDVKGGIARRPIIDLDTLPFPGWDDIPLQNYWRLRYAHGPMTGRYLALLTSRGCPYRCRFCVVPQTNKGKWRARSPKNVVDEMEHNKERFGVSEFHWEDLNPTIDRERMVLICNDILGRGLRVDWKLVSGTKIETLDGEALALMARAGCRYLSFSPESGSPVVLEAMDKTFDFEHGVAMTRAMRRLSIRSQACFVIGFPGERSRDLCLTAAYARTLLLAGVDEIAYFIITPVPGTPTFDHMKGYESLSELTFSPAWREDYRLLSRWRLRHYLLFLLLKTVRFPVRVVRQCINFMRRYFETKMEMTPYRALHQRLVSLRARPYE